MIPHCGGEPKRGLNSQIIKDFGSISRFKKHFSTAAEKVEAVRLGLQAEKHQNLSQWDVIPLLVLDVWEQACYLMIEKRILKPGGTWSTGRM
jgi:Fe-Mn family superoxide dismutase